jgi:TetR/AcrR family tetracycline transcriptional repressor
MARQPKARAERAASAGTLTKERIAGAALDLVDRVGLEKFSVRDLAKALGVYPTAIYHHMVDRSMLLGEMAGYALHHAYLEMTDFSSEARSDWRAWIREYFQKYRAAIHQHPKIAPLFGAQILSGGPIQSNIIEALLARLESAGFKGESLVNAYNVVIAAQVGFVTLELAAVPGEEGSRWMEDHQRRIRTIDALAYPTLARNLPLLANRSFILRWTNGTTVPLDASFGMFVDTVIRGLEAIRDDLVKAPQSARHLDVAQPIAGA